MVSNADPAPRRKQQRAIETRGVLLDTATAAFSAKGYDGSSLRQLEELAGVKRGLIAYHFGDKETLWREVVDRLFGALAEDFAGRLQTLADVAPHEAAKAVARAFVHYSAAHPALNRLMVQESMNDSWRVAYIVDEHIRPLLDNLDAALPAAAGHLWGSRDPHRFYLFIGASAYVFTAEQECRRLFGRSTRDSDFIECHADLVVEMLLADRPAG